MKRSAIMPILLVISGAILIFGSAAWLLSMNGNETALPSESDQSNPESSTEIQRVGIAEAKTAYDNRKAVFIDVRGDQYFAEKHIPGALSIPESEITNQMSQLNPSDWIITYCT